MQIKRLNRKKGFMVEKSGVENSGVEKFMAGKSGLKSYFWIWG
jgi:hypothetical protein